MRSGFNMAGSPYSKTAGSAPPVEQLRHRLRLAAAFLVTRAERAAGRAARMSLLMRAFLGGPAFIRLPVMTFKSSVVTYARSRSDWKIFNPPSSIDSESDRITTSAELGGSY